jgi:hypothetical protein
MEAGEKMSRPKPLLLSPRHSAGIRADVLDASGKVFKPTEGYILKKYL